MYSSFCTGCLRRWVGNQNVSTSCFLPLHLWSVSLLACDISWLLLTEGLRTKRTGSSASCLRCLTALSMLPCGSKTAGSRDFPRRACVKPLRGDSQLLGRRPRSVLEVTPPPKKIAPVAKDCELSPAGVQRNSAASTPISKLALAFCQNLCQNKEIYTCVCVCVCVTYT